MVFTVQEFKHIFIETDVLHEKYGQLAKLIDSKTSRSRETM